MSKKKGHFTPSKETIDDIKLTPLDELKDKILNECERIANNEIRSVFKLVVYTKEYQAKRDALKS